MLKLTGADGAYRVIDDQTGQVVLNVAQASYRHEAGSPPKLTLEVFGAVIDAEALVGGETCRIVGDGHHTEVMAPDGHHLINVRSVEVTAGPTSASGVVTMAGTQDEAEEASSPVEGAEDEPSKPETPEVQPAPLEDTPADPTDAASEGGSTSEPSSNDAAEPTPEEAPQAPRGRRPRG